MVSTEPTGVGAGQGANKRLAHIVLQTGQLPVLKEWYLTVLDAHVVFENDMLSFITFDDEHHRLAMVQLSEPVPRTSMTVGMAHSAYTFASLDSLLTKYRALKEAGIEPHVPVQHGPTTSIYYRDPDGNMVELQIDNMAPGDATAYMCGEEYSLDPIGPSFDPDAMLLQLQAGTPQSDLTTRAWALMCPQLNVYELLLT